MIVCLKISLLVKTKFVKNFFEKMFRKQLSKLVIVAREN